MKNATDRYCGSKERQINYQALAYEYLVAHFFYEEEVSFIDVIIRC